MEYRQLGRTGVPVSVIGVGGNQFGSGADEQQTARIVDRAIDRGINFIDTADMYTRSVSEQFLGKALQGKRDQVVLATKTGMRMNDGPEGIGLSRRRIMSAVDASLKRLNTDYIDLYYMHAPDPRTSIDETLRAMDDLVTSGKIRYCAFSNFSGWQTAEVIGLCERRGYQAAGRQSGPLQPDRARHRERAHSGLRALRSQHRPILAARQWISDRQVSSR